MGYKFTLTLDDDCYPCTDADGIEYDGAGFINEHLKWMTGRTRWHNTLSTAWPRGIPYKSLGRADNVMINHGLWTNVLDYDAPHQLVAPAKEEFAFNNQVIPAGLYFPMCGMNLMFRRDAAVLMYHLLMGQMFEKFIGGRGPDLHKLPFDRFGDIWCGIIAKKICDARGLMISSGMPYIRHERASDPFANLRKEANGIGANEKFWELVDRVDNSELAQIYALPTAYEHVANHVMEFGSEIPGFDTYFDRLGIAMRVWTKLFREG
jgi:hypothetical protein